MEPITEVEYLPERDENLPVNCATCSSLGMHGTIYLCRRLYSIVGQIHSPIKCYRYSRKGEANG